MLVFREGTSCSIISSAQKKSSRVSESRTFSGTKVLGMNFLAGVEPKFCVFCWENPCVQCVGCLKNWENVLNESMLFIA